MKLKPFSETGALSKEKIAKSMAPVRARKVRSKAALEMAILDDRILRTEAEVQALCSKEEIDFPALLDSLDTVALLERRKVQYTRVLADLFPVTKK